MLRFDITTKHFICLAFSTYHEREDDGDDFDGLDDPEDCQAHDLDPCEEVNPTQRNMAEEHVIGLVLWRHEQDQESLHQLETHKEH